MGRDEAAPHGGGSAELERLALFSDAVFAIAITLLVLELKVPEREAVEAAGGLGRALIAEIPRFYAFLVSFVVIGSYWTLHHRMFRYLRRCDERLVALNLTLLLFVAFLPFPVALFGSFRRDPVAIGWYVASMLLTGASLNLLWWYAAGKRHLFAPDLDRRIIRYVQFRAAVLPLVFAVSLPFAFVSPAWTIGSVITMVLPARLLGRRLERMAREAEGEAAAPVSVPGPADVPPAAVVPPARPGPVAGRALPVPGSARDAPTTPSPAPPAAPPEALAPTAARPPDPAPGP